MFFLSFFLSFLDFFAMAGPPLDVVGHQAGLPRGTSTRFGCPAAPTVNVTEIRRVRKPNEGEQMMSQATAVTGGTTDINSSGQPSLTLKIGLAASFLKAVRAVAVLLMLMSRSPWSSWAVSKYTIALMAGRLASSARTLL